MDVKKKIKLEPRTKIFESELLFFVYLKQRYGMIFTITNFRKEHFYVSVYVSVWKSGRDLFFDDLFGYINGSASRGSGRIHFSWNGIVPDGGK